MADILSLITTGDTVQNRYQSLRALGCGRMQRVDLLCTRDICTAVICGIIISGVRQRTRVTKYCCSLRVFTMLFSNCKVHAVLLRRVTPIPDRPSHFSLFHRCIALGLLRQQVRLLWAFENRSESRLVPETPIVTSHPVMMNHRLVIIISLFDE